MPLRSWIGRVGVQPVDCPTLLLEPALAEPVRVVADRVVVVAARDRLGDHRLEACPCRRTRSCACAGRRAGRRARRGPAARRRAPPRALPALAQLGRDPRRSRGIRRPPPRSRTRALARLDLGDPVLGDREPAPNGRLAQGDVVVLRAGEVLQQVAVASGGTTRRSKRRPSWLITVAFVPPFAATSTTHGSSQNASISACRRRSPSRSGRGRARSRGSAAPTLRSRPEQRPGGRRSVSSTARSRGSTVPRSARLGPSTACGFPSAARIFSSDLGPRPASPRSSCASAAALRPSTVVIPSSFQSRRAVFGPRPGRCMKLATSTGTSALRFVSA